jgi:glycosyltransferase involved in cell wall biosynthesis
MKILLLGEYSNVHATLAEGLRELGHDVTVISNGDFWKDYPRDVDLSRKLGKLGGIVYWIKANWLKNNVMKDYDVVQLINPMFLELKAERILPFYKYLRRHNKKVFLGAFGMDYYWVNENITRKPLRYSDFNFGETLRNDKEALKERKDWLNTSKQYLNQYIAKDCDGIITGLYEYWACYQPLFPQKTTFIPFPIKRLPEKEEELIRENFPKDNSHKVRLFIGISKNRSIYKGTDIMLAAAKAIQEKYNDLVELKKVEGVPFSQYQKLMNGSDAILDQLYSYTPSMNPLEAMKRGIICIGGGEPENYEILNEEELRPIINVAPNYESVYNELEQLVLHRERIPQLKKDSLEYIKRHHDYIKVARQYEKFYGLEKKI